MRVRARDGRALLFAHTQFVRPGLGAVRKTTQVEAGATVGVFGLGAVGLGGIAVTAAAARRRASQNS